MTNDQIWIGCDPGGKAAFGIAGIARGLVLFRKLCNFVDDAVRSVDAELARNPEMHIAGIGIDAPLWWSSGEAGWRMADRRIQRKYGLGSGRVQSVSSLRGAAIAQGPLFALHMRRKFPNSWITETHPKVQFTEAMNKRKRNEILHSIIDQNAVNDVNEHERDAILSAIAAYMGQQGRWSCDLVRQRYTCEVFPFGIELADVHYAWPEDIPTPPK